MTLRFLVGLMLVVPVVASAQSEKAPTKGAGDARIDAYLAREADRLSQTPFGGAKTREQWERIRPRLREEYLEMLGLWPLPERTPLHATVTGTVDLKAEGIVIEKLHYQSKPGLYVTANLYRPAVSTGRLPAVLYVCGHADKGRDGNKTAYQEHPRWFAANGYVCLSVDTLQLSEIRGIHHGTYREGRWWWQARGYTPAGVECWNGVRGIDYLTSRADVDPERIAVTGISGGGAATFWIAAADERVKCAVPVSGMSDLQSYVAGKVVNGHCDCMFMLNTYGWEWTTIAALVAPRPLLFANSDQDGIFPMDGNGRIIARLRAFYTMLGQPELVDDYVSKGGHAYRPDLRVAVYRWINEHIKGDVSPIKDAEFEPLPGALLRVFPEDRDLPKDAINAKVDESFVPLAESRVPAAEGFDAWKQRKLDELERRSFRNVVSQRKGLAAVAGVGTVPESVESEPGTSVELGFRRGFAKREASAALVIVNPEEDAKGMPQWAGSAVADSAVLVIAPRGGGDGRWSRKSPPNYVERAHALVGRTVDEGRVWDILATFHRVRGSAERWKFVGRGQAGILGAYAALWEPAVEVVVVDPPVSHRQGPIFLNVMRTLDVPDALGMLAPRRLTLIGARDPAFDRTAAIYQAARAADKLARPE